jgi:hypothetical protein
MHIIDTKAGEQARTAAMERPPFGPGFTSEEAMKASTLEVHGSSFSDPGEDFTEFRLLDAAGTVIGTRRVGGF